MAKFTVHKEIIQTYAVEVEADDATDAVIKAYDNEHDEGETVDEESHNETGWSVFDIDDYRGEALPTDAERIKKHLRGE